MFHKRNKVNSGLVNKATFKLHAEVAQIFYAHMQLGSAFLWNLFCTDGSHSKDIPIVGHLVNMSAKLVSGWMVSYYTHKYYSGSSIQAHLKEKLYEKNLSLFLILVCVRLIFRAQIL